jgi:hypothetical protein
MTNDAVSLLRELRPFEDFAPDEAALERILSAPPLPRRRRARRRVLTLAGAVALAAAAVALAPSSSPDVIARAAAALNDPDTILHLKYVKDGHTMEIWEADGGRKERWIYDGGTGKAVESAEDWDAKSAVSYGEERDELVTHTDPDFFDPAHRIQPGLDVASPAVRPTDNLAQVLERARHGDKDIRLIGETEVNGAEAYELRLEYTIQVIDVPPGKAIRDPRGLPTKPLRLARDIYIDREKYLPLRVIDYGPPGAPATMTDYVVAERLPRTPATEQLLRMSPHPGAKQVTEGRL